jgi:hypothetical protein
VQEKEATENYLCNPKIEVIALKLPPREGPDDEICCKWEYIMRDKPVR